MLSTHQDNGKPVDINFSMAFEKYFLWLDKNFVAFYHLNKINAGVKPLVFSLPLCKKNTNRFHIALAFLNTA